jgi:hypothetical protein
MIIRLPDEAELWEAVAAIQVAQSQGATGIDICPGNVEVGPLLEMAGLSYIGPPTQGPKLDTARAFRMLGSTKSMYPEILAATAGLDKKPIVPPQFPRIKIKPDETGGVIVTPFEVHESFRMPWTVWRAVIRHLRSYGVPVSLLGRRGQRADYSNFTEGAILSNLSVEEKLEALARSQFVMGVPNEWTWAATAWGKKVGVLHPEDIPHDRWFGFATVPWSLGRILYSSSQIQIPPILAQLRHLISLM